MAYTCRAAVHVRRSSLLRMAYTCCAAVACSQIEDPSYYAKSGQPPKWLDSKVGIVSIETSVSSTLDVLDLPFASGRTEPYVLHTVAEALSGLSCSTTP